jgi:hypothetical protein
VPDDRLTPLTHGEEGKYDARAPEGLGGYIFLHFLTVLPVTVFLLFQSAHLALWQSAALAVGIAWTLANLGGLFDRRRWAFPSELLRLMAVALAGVGTAHPAAALPLGLVAVGAVLYFGLSAAWLVRRRPSSRDAEEIAPAA